MAARKTAVKKEVTGATLDKLKAEYIKAREAVEASKAGVKKNEEAMKEKEKAFKDALKEFSSLCILTSNKISGKFEDIKDSLVEMYKNIENGEYLKVYFKSGGWEGYTGFVTRYDSDDECNPLKLSFYHTEIDPNSVGIVTGKQIGRAHV